MTERIRFQNPEGDCITVFESSWDYVYNKAIYSRCELRPNSYSVKTISKKEFEVAKEKAEQVPEGR